MSSKAGTHRTSPAIWVAMIALTVALGGTALAAPVALRALSKSEVRQIKEIAKKQIEKAEPKLSVAKAASADSAANADKLDGLDSAQFLRGDTCQAGAVSGYARFDPLAMADGQAYSTAGVSHSRNCSGGSVEAQYLSEGDYRIRFNGSPAAIAICGKVEDGDSTPTIISQSTSLISPGHWRVRQGDLVNNVVEDAKFACIVV